jgi:hypothetical protein
MDIDPVSTPTCGHTKFYLPIPTEVGFVLEDYQTIRWHYYGMGIGEQRLKLPWGPNYTIHRYMFQLPSSMPSL